METTCSEGEVFFAQALSGAAIPARFSSAQVQALARKGWIRGYADAHHSCSRLRSCCTYCQLRKHVDLSLAPVAQSFSKFCHHTLFKLSEAFTTDADLVQCDLTQPTRPSKHVPALPVTGIPPPNNLSEQPFHCYD